MYSEGDFQQFTIKGSFGVSSTSIISVNYINDASGPGGDRNLFVGSVTVDGRVFQGSVAALGGDGVLSDSGALWSDGSLNFDMAAPAPNPTGGLSMLGVNLSGAEEFGAYNPHTVLGVDYAYPTNAELQYYASKGLKVIRLPFQWERLQPSLNGPLSSADLAQIDRVVSYANSLGMKVILDPHNYAAYDGNPIGSAATPISAFDNLWSQLAGHYAGNSKVLFGLMNEPNLLAATWLDAANSAIAAIRATGATSQKILVSGIDSDTSSSWLTSGNATSLGNAIVDSANNYAFEVHEYFNSDGSGVGGDTVSTAIGVDRMAAITEWARDSGKQLFLGEFGSNSDPTALAALKNTLSFMTTNSDVWLGGTEWEASTSYNYYFNIAPANGVDSAQMDVLDQFASIGHGVIDGTVHHFGSADPAWGSAQSNVAVSLINSAGDVIATKVSDRSGWFDFTGLAAGSYALHYSPPAGEALAPGSAANSTTGLTAPFAVAASGTVWTPTEAVVSSSNAFTLDGVGAVAQRGDGSYIVSGDAEGGRLALGNGSSTVTMSGLNNTIVTGNGNQTITLAGQDNSVVVGVGNSSISSGSGGAVVQAAGGHVVISADGSGNLLDGGAGMSFLTAAGASNTFVTAGPGAGATTITGFGLAQGDVLNLGRTLSGLDVQSDLANIGSFVTANLTGGNTILSVDRNGPGGATVFAVLDGVAASVAQLVTAHALSLAR